MAATKRSPSYNFHVPLPHDLYQQLRSEADISEEPATVLARRAIELWLQKRERERRHEAIASYAAEMAGTEADLQPEFEAAAIDHWLEEEKRTRKGRKR